MKAICDTCGARYRIPEGKLDGKILRIRCRKCENVFTVHADSVVDEGQRSPAGEWYFAISGESFGPYTERELLDRFESGRLNTETFIWKQGFSEWLPVTEHPTFAAAIELAKSSLSSRARFQQPAKPSPHTASEGSGRFTLEVRRPGATLGDGYNDDANTIDSEVDEAFDSLIGSIRNDPTTDEFDSPTEPMRNLNAAMLATAAKRVANQPAPRPKDTTITSIAGQTAAATRERSPATQKNDPSPERKPVPKPAREERAAPVTRQPIAAEKPKATSERPKPAVAPASAQSTQAPQRPKAQSAQKAAPPARPSSAGTAGLSLSERLRQIREQSASKSAETSALPPTSTHRGLPPSSAASPVARSPIATKSAPIGSSTEPHVLGKSDDADLFRSDAQSSLDPLSKLFNDDALQAEKTAIGSPLQAAATDPQKAQPETPQQRHSNEHAGTDEASAILARDVNDDLFASPTAEETAATPAIPRGPIRQVTQEINIDDLFSGEDTGNSSAQPALTDEEIQSFLHNRMKSPSSAALKQAAEAPSPRAHQDDIQTPVGGTPAVRLDPIAPTATAPSTEHTADANFQAPTTSPQLVAVPAKDIESLANQRATQQKWITRLLIALLLLLGTFLLIFVARVLQAPASEETVVAEHDIPTAAETRQNPDEIRRARNRATSIVAQAQATAFSRANTATERSFSTPTTTRRTPQRSTRTDTRGEAAAMGFNLEASARPTANTVRREEASGPTAAHFANTLQGGVRSSVGRCAQRARAMDGGLAFSRLELSVTIRPDGTVERINSQRAIRDSTFMNCMRTESTRWRFASFTGSNTTITHPYVLQ